MNKFQYIGSSINKSFEQYVNVLSDVNFCLNNSDSLAITGPNGSGKSTLLKIMAGVLSMSSGETKLEIDGQTISKNDYTKHYAFVAPYLQVYEEFTPVELIDLYCKFKGMKVNRGRFDLLIEQFNLKKKRHNIIMSFF